MSGSSARGRLSTALKRALVILSDGGNAKRETNCWRALHGEQIHMRTIESLYERYLVKIVVESRHRRRHTAILTDVGELAAREIQRQLSNEYTRPNAIHGVSEHAARFINEIVS